MCYTSGMKNRVPISAFRKGLLTITEPTEVVRYPQGEARLVGTWYPAGTEKSVAQPVGTSGSGTSGTQAKRDEILRRINKK